MHFLNDVPELKSCCLDCYNLVSAFLDGDCFGLDLADIDLSLLLVVVLFLAFLDYDYIVMFPLGGVVLSIS